jgi:ankyrin repeat protein
MATQDDEQTGRALRQAAREGVGVSLLLDHPAADGSADAAAMLMAADNHGWTALMWAAFNGRADAMRLLLDHPSADAAAMLLAADKHGWIAFQWAASNGHADAMCLLRNRTTDAFMTAARAGRVDVLRLLLDHPCANAAAMLTHRRPRWLHRSTRQRSRPTRRARTHAA